MRDAGMGFGPFRETVTASSMQLILTKPDKKNRYPDVRTYNSIFHNFSVRASRLHPPGRMR
jgi:hypothetical protein